MQGYKFHIFYPDLIDKTKAPTYKIEREDGRKKGQSSAPAGEEDTCIISQDPGAVEAGGRQVVLQRLRERDQARRGLGLARDRSEGEIAPEANKGRLDGLLGGARDLGYIDHGPR